MEVNGLRYIHAKLLKYFNEILLLNSICPYNLFLA